MLTAIDLILLFFGIGISYFLAGLLIDQLQNWLYKRKRK